MVRRSGVLKEITAVNSRNQLSGHTTLNDEFSRIKRLPPYIFNIVGELKAKARAQGEDIIDFSMGNPDQPTPQHIVDKMIEAAQRGDTHRYSVSKGIPRLRRASCNWYKKRFDVDLDMDTEAIVTIGSKEGLAHLALAHKGPGAVALVPTPSYPLHPYGFLIWGAHDSAYADFEVDGYVAPSSLQVPGAKDIAVEFFTLSKSYNMPGWRIGFMCGNHKLVAALARMKSYLDYGMFTPILVAAITALERPQDCVDEIRELYRCRRDVLCKGLNSIGWQVTPPRGSMFVWAPIPEPYRHMGSLEFSKKLLQEAKVAVSPGVGFGEQGDDHVRFALIENEHRTRQAIRGIRDMFRRDQGPAKAQACGVKY